MTSFGVSRSDRAVDRHAGEHLPPGRTGLVGFLAEHVLDPQDVGQGQVAIVTQQPLRQCLPPDQALAVDVRDVAQDVRADRRSELQRHLGRQEDEAAIGIRSAAFNASRPPIPCATITAPEPNRSMAATTSSV